jgi:hypothetical protein
MKKLLLFSVLVLPLLTIQNSFADDYNGLNGLGSFDFNNVKYTKSDGTTLSYNPDEGGPTIANPDGSIQQVNPDGTATNGNLKAHHNVGLPKDNFNVNGQTNINNIQGNYSPQINPPKTKNNFHKAGLKLSQSGGADLAFYLAMLLLLFSSVIITKKRNFV